MAKAQKTNEATDEAPRTLKLGDVVRDKITNVEGVLTARTEFLYGCVRWVVQPQAEHEGRPVEPCSYDEQQLDFINEGDDWMTGANSDTGGPHTEAQRADGATRR